MLKWKKKKKVVLFYEHATKISNFQFFNKIVTLPFQSHTHPCVPTISRNERKEEWVSGNVSAVKALASHQHVPDWASDVKGLLQEGYKCMIQPWTPKP